MYRDPRCALNQELEAKQTLLDQLRALATDDPAFFTLYKTKVSYVPLSVVNSY